MEKYVIKQLNTSSPITSLSAIYTVPVASATTLGSVEVSPKAASSVSKSCVSSLVISGPNGTAGTVRVALTSADSDVTYLLWKYAVPSQGTKICDFGLVLSPGDSISCGGSTNYAWTLSSIETTEGSGPNV